MTYVTVMDTLRLANRLKNAGVPSEQAEAMSQAFNDEVAGGVATQAGLDSAVSELRAEIQAVDAKLDSAVSELRAEIKENTATLRAEIQAVDAKLDGAIVELRSEIKSVDAKVDRVIVEMRWMKYLTMFVLAFLTLLVAFLALMVGVSGLFRGPEPPAPAPQTDPLRAPQVLEAPAPTSPVGVVEVSDLQGEAGTLPPAAPRDETGPPP